MAQGRLVADQTNVVSLRSLFKYGFLPVRVLLRGERQRGRRLQEGVGRESQE